MQLSSFPTLLVLFTRNIGVTEPNEVEKHIPGYDTPLVKLKVVNVDENLLKL